MYHGEQLCHSLNYVSQHLQDQKSHADVAETRD